MGTTGDRCATGGRPLPVAPYVPGVTPRPENGHFIEIAERAPQVTDPARWRESEAWLYGFALYEGGFFWEAHEVWEPVWMGLAPNSAERFLAQGLIQAANCCLKLVMGRPRAAARLARHAADCLSESARGGQAEVMGVDVSRAAAEAETFAERLWEAGWNAEDCLRRRPTFDLAASHEI